MPLSRLQKGSKGWSSVVKAYKYSESKGKNAKKFRGVAECSGSAFKCSKVQQSVVKCSNSVVKVYKCIQSKGESVKKIQRGSQV